MVLERAVMETVLEHEVVHQQVEQEAEASGLSAGDCCPLGPFAVGSASFQVDLVDLARHHSAWLRSFAARPLVAEGSIAVRLNCQGVS